MDQVLNKVGSYWFSKRASKEIDSIGDDISVSARPPLSFSSCRARLLATRFFTCIA